MNHICIFVIFYICKASDLPGAISNHYPESHGNTEGWALLSAVEYHLVETLIVHSYIVPFPICIFVSFYVFWFCIFVYSYIMFIY